MPFITIWGYASFLFSALRVCEQKKVGNHCSIGYQLSSGVQMNLLLFLASCAGESKVFVGSHVGVDGELEIVLID